MRSLILLCKPCANDETYIPKIAVRTRGAKAIEILETSSVEESQETSDTPIDGSCIDDSDEIKKPEQYCEIVSNYSTERLLRISSNLFNEMCISLESKQTQLGSSSGWLEKKQSSVPCAWLKRWVVLKDGFFLWSERQITIENDVDRKEKRRWNQCINLGRRHVMITHVESKTERKFTLNTKRRGFLFKAQDQNHRDIWVHALKQHMQYAREKSLFSK
eukprot:178752_1